MFNVFDQGICDNTNIILLYTLYFSWTVNNATSKRNKFRIMSLLLLGIPKRYSECTDIITFINEHECNLIYILINKFPKSPGYYSRYVAFGYDKHLTHLLWHVSDRFTMTNKRSFDYDKQATLLLCMPCKQVALLLRQSCVSFTMTSKCPFCNDKLVTHLPWKANEPFAMIKQVSLLLWHASEPFAMTN